MSERTAAALVKLDDFVASLRAIPSSREREQLIEEVQHLRRAVEAFHMEAIRFRMYSVDRLLGSESNASRHAFDELRHALEAAGFHTRSHTAP